MVMDFPAFLDELEKIGGPFLTPERITSAISNVGKEAPNLIGLKDRIRGNEQRMGKITSSMASKAVKSWNSPLASRASAKGSALRSSAANTLAKRTAYRDGIDALRVQTGLHRW
jgi:hypothetical protein